MKKDYLYRLNEFRLIITAKTAVEAVNKAEKIYLDHINANKFVRKNFSLSLGRFCMELGFFNGK